MMNEVSDVLVMILVINKLSNTIKNLTYDTLTKYGII